MPNATASFARLNFRDLVGQRRDERRQGGVGPGLAKNQPMVTVVRFVPNATTTKDRVIMVVPAMIQSRRRPQLESSTSSAIEAP